MKLENLEKAKTAQADLEHALQQANAKFEAALAAASCDLRKHIALLFTSDSRGDHRFVYAEGADGFCKMMEAQSPIYRKACADAIKTRGEEITSAQATFNCLLSKL